MAAGQLERPQSPWKSAWVAAVVVAVAGGLLASVVALSQRVGGSSAPAQPPAFATPVVSTVTAVNVKQRSGDSLTVVDRDGHERQITVPATTIVERLSEVPAGDIRPGDSITVAGIPNEVLSFSIRFVVLMAAPAAQVEGIARSPGGFAGHEASLDPNDRPIVGGVVQSVSSGGDVVVFAGPSGPATLRLNEARSARILRLEPVSAPAIKEGDRLAADFSQTPLRAILVTSPRD